MTTQAPRDDHWFDDDWFNDAPPQQVSSDPVTARIPPEFWYDSFRTLLRIHAIQKFAVTVHLDDTWHFQVNMESIIVTYPSRHARFCLHFNSGIGILNEAHSGQSELEIVMGDLKDMLKSTDPGARETTITFSDPDRSPNANEWTVVQQLVTTLIDALNNFATSSQLSQPIAHQHILPSDYVNELNTSLLSQVKERFRISLDLPATQTPPVSTIDIDERRELAYMPDDVATEFRPEPNPENVRPIRSSNEFESTPSEPNWNPESIELGDPTAPDWTNSSGDFCYLDPESSRFLGRASYINTPPNPTEIEWPSSPPID
ncbi:hypothetical protein EB093_04205 [bacterium]|nr:hypothetical protein [bacterium]